MKKYFYKTISFSIILLPLAAFAAGLIPSDAEITKNGFCAFATLINNVINWFIGISVSVAAITFAIAGAKILFNPGNSGKRTEAIEMFKKTIIGMFIVLGAWLVVHTIISTLVSPSTNALRFLGGSCQ